MTPELPALLAVLLVGTALAALLFERLVYSLIALFYSGLLLGAVFLLYGASYAGLFQIITFAGAVSVMFMVILMLVGREPTPSGPSFSPERLIGYGLAIGGFVVVLVILSQFALLPIRIDEAGVTQSLGIPTDDPLMFLWSLRSWDLMFLLILISAAIAGIVNLFSKEGFTE